LTDYLLKVFTDPVDIDGALWVELAVWDHHRDKAIAASQHSYQEKSQSVI